MALSVKDLMLVRKELYEAAPKWYDLGLVLGLDNTTLKKIRKDENDTNDCFRETIAAWLESSSEAPKTWSTLADALKAKTVGLGHLATEIEKDHCQQSQPQSGEKRPHPSSDESEPALKRPCLEEGCNCEELRKLLHTYDQRTQEQDIRLNRLETSIQALAEDNNDLKKENAKLKSRCSKLEKQAREHSGKLEKQAREHLDELEKQVKEYSGILEKQVEEHLEQLQQLITQTSKVNKSAPKPTSTETSEVDDNIQWMRKALHDVRDDWYEFGCEFGIGLKFLDDIKSKHSEDSKHCLFLVLREWLTQLEAEGDKGCKICKLIQVLESPLLYYDIVETLEDMKHPGCLYGRSCP
jgi:myosin heavy subunit